ncbi:hypothetical protein WJ17_25325 [Burkholderia vietnamiensis]|nr:hypothetical protein WJ17_25325 [Burkholderia vietnamiensis]
MVRCGSAVLVCASKNGRAAIRIRGRGRRTSEATARAGVTTNAFIASMRSMLAEAVGDGCVMGGAHAR